MTNKVFPKGVVINMIDNNEVIDHDHFNFEGNSNFIRWALNESRHYSGTEQMGTFTHWVSTAVQNQYEENEHMVSRSPLFDIDGETYQYHFVMDVPVFDIEEQWTMKFDIHSNLTIDHH